MKPHDDREKIVSFYIYKSPVCHYIPGGVAENFINIQVLIVAWSGLKVVRQSDLKSLVNLKKLNIDHNNIETLPRDLFMYNGKLESINLSSNQIKQIPANIFDSLANLIEVFLIQNVCINMEARTPREIQELKVEMATACLPKESEPGDSDDIRSVIKDLQIKVKSLESQMLKLRTNFCTLNNDWKNENCRDVVTTPKSIHPEDQTEGIIVD